MKLLLVDNFDSFVYNLAQAFGALGAEPAVARNDASVEELEALDPDAVVISPGPGTPEEAGVSIEAIRRFGARMPLLGVCLGHQCIAAAYGGVVSRAPVGPRHGRTSAVEHDGAGVLAGLPSPFIATRYHSLAIEPGFIPEALEVTARSDDGTVMALRHRNLAVEGVQFHPESVLTPDGPRLLANFLEATTRRRPERMDERSAS
ncbi:MAG: aminodeoxychorismate/anthranilate synthase component II [Actinomycetota bacterium]|nr:aminodeoxychorismate/anthranilate synthase component II [Actinomycetota bacterium]